MNKHILITGTKGYLSNHFEQKLLEQNCHVDRISVRKADWEMIPFEKYDAIIHTAALVHNNDPSARLSDYMSVNTNLTEKLAKKAKASGVKQFIFMSTMSVFGKDGQVGKLESIDQDTPLKPDSDYGISKLRAEQKLRALESSAFKVAIVRPPMIYGADCPGNFKRLKNMAAKLPIIPEIENARSAIYIGHLTDFVYQLIKEETGGTYHPQDDFEFNTTKVMCEIRKQLDKNTALIKVPTVTYPVLNKLKVFKKLFGNLIYDRGIDSNTANMETTQAQFASVIETIVKIENQK